MMPASTPAPELPPLKRARQAGAVAMGLIVGLLLVVALFQFMLDIGDLSAFQYQGY